MCGIVGYVGGNFADPVLIVDLERLEYRGYDSAGIATVNAGEFKHGPIALVEAGHPVVCIATHGELYEKMLSNIHEVRARKGKIIAVTTEGDDDLCELADHCLTMPECSDHLGPIVSVMPLQLLAYHVAAMRGCDVDKPRNLAKSVTVE